MINIPYVLWLFYLVSFILFSIKARGLITTYLIPYLKESRQADIEKQFTLEEHNAILIVQKKQLATQFLQQEKQLSLLSAKLEHWYSNWRAHQEEKKAALAQRNREIFLKLSQQAQNRQDTRQYREQIREALSELEKDLPAGHAHIETKKAFFTLAVDQCVKKLSDQKPGEL